VFPHAAIFGGEAGVLIEPNEGAFGNLRHVFSGVKEKGTIPLSFIVLLYHT